MQLCDPLTAFATQLMPYLFGYGHGYTLKSCDDGTTVSIPLSVASHSQTFFSTLLNYSRLQSD